MHRPLSTLATAALISLLAAGCGSEPAESDGGSASRAATTTATTRAQPSAREKAVKFSECIRQHGVSDFPDPDADNDFQYGVSVSPAVWAKAVRACKDLQPPGSLSTKRNRKEQSAGLRFAACIRENGVKDFPDPVDGEPLIDTTKIPSTDAAGGMDILNAAIAKCRRTMDEVLGGSR